MQFIKTPFLIRMLFHTFLWKVKTNQKVVYLTFDDGPIPEVTNWVLQVLKTENIRATFFCIGDNIQKHPEVFKNIVADEHSIGNHTFNHLNGWKTPSEKYLENVKKCDEIIRKFGIKTTLFRPPYGKTTPKQATKLQKKGYQMVCWDILTYDFEPTLNPKTTYTKIQKAIENGSILVFHDSLKAQKNLKYILPKLITDLKKRGFSFGKI